MNDRTDEVFVSMQRDYRSVLGGGVATEGQLLPKSERLLRKDVLRIVEGVESIFRKVARGEVVEDDDEEEGKEVDEDTISTEEATTDRSAKLDRESESPPQSASEDVGPVKHAKSPPRTPVKQEPQPESPLAKPPASASGEWSFGGIEASANEAAAGDKVIKTE